MRICSTCGERNEDWMDICQRCGGSITNANVDNSYDTPVDYGNNYNDYREYDNNYYDDNNSNNYYYQDSSKSSNKLPKERKKITNLDLKIILVILIIILVCLIIYAFF